MNERMPNSFDAFAENKAHSISPSAEKANELIGKKIELSSENRWGSSQSAESIISTVLHNENQDAFLDKSPAFRWYVENSKWLQDTSRFLESSTTAEQKRLSEKFLQVLDHYLPEKSEGLKHGIASELAAKHVLEHLNCDVRRTVPVVDAGLGIDFLVRTKDEPQRFFTIQIKTNTEARSTTETNRFTGEKDIYPEMEVITPQYLQKIEKYGISEKERKDLHSLNRCLKNTELLNNHSIEPFTPVVIYMPSYHLIKENVDAANLHLGSALAKNWQQHLEPKWKQILSIKKEYPDKQIITHKRKAQHVRTFEPK